MAVESMMEYTLVGGELRIDKIVLVQELLGRNGPRRGLWAGAIRGATDAEGRVAVGMGGPGSVQFAESPRDLLASLASAYPGKIEGRVMVRSVYTTHRVVSHFALEIHPDGTLTETGPQ